MRCYIEKNPYKIINAICDLNLESCKEVSRGGSGAFMNVQDGVPIKGGYLVKHKKKVIGWGVAFGRFGPERPKQTHIFIVPQYRKNGMGSTLVRRAKKDFPDYKFVPWNPYTDKFYKERKVPTLNHNRYERT